MSAADKAKLDGIASGANKYVLPTATSTSLGGVCIGFPESGKNYPVELNDSNQMYVNVPWTDTNTTYTLSSFGITATAAELNYCDGVTSNIQTQLNGKLSTSGTAAAATKLATSRTIALSGDASGSASFNGTANATIATTVLHHGTTEIGSNANLDSYTDPGWYYCPANATVATMTNCPTSNAFTMFVSQHAGTNQMLIEYMTSSPRIWMRNYYQSAWGSWYEIYSTGHKPTPADIGAATSGHTHNYAGSSSSGGSATTALALTTNAGSSTQPVYFSGGKPVACTYTLGKSVPSNAVFTDTTYSAISTSYIDGLF